jgi:hypothetical protein
MSAKELIKEGVKLAEEELKEEEKMRIKSVVKATLELLRQKEEKRQLLDDDIKILRRDIEDMKDGRIDRIKERQDLDPKAKEVSVIIIKEKIVEKHIPTPWYVPWIIEVKPQYVPLLPTFWCTTASPNVGVTYELGMTEPTIATYATANDISSIQFVTNNSMTHMYTSGTYCLTDGTVKHL